MCFKRAVKVFQQILIKKYFFQLMPKSMEVTFQDRTVGQISRKTPFSLLHFLKRVINKMKMATSKFLDKFCTPRLLRKTSFSSFLPLQDLWSDR